MPESISIATNLITPTYHCLFSNVNNICAYYSGTQISFSLGEAISAIGIIFAVYQLKKPDWDIRLKIHRWVTRNLVWIFGLLGLASVLTSVIISNIAFGVITNIFEVPLFYEILGFIFFILSPLSLFIYGSEYKKIFTYSNAKRFYIELHHNIERIDPQRLEACITIISENLVKLLDSFKQKEYNPNEYSKELQYYASAVFNVILSERKVADYIVTQRMDFILKLFTNLKKYPEASTKIKGGVDRIFQRLFYNENSFLANQLDWGKGMALSANLNEILFNDYDSLAKIYCPFHDIPPHITGEYHSISLTLFLNAFEKAVKSYFSKARECIDNQALIKGFQAIDEYAETLSMSLWTGEITLKEARFDLSTIANYYGDRFLPLFGKARGENILYSLEERLSNFEWPESLQEVYVSSLFNFIEKISQFHPKKDEEYSLFFYLQHAFSGLFDKDDFVEMRNKLLELIWKHITEKNLKGSFPSIMRSYLLLLPWWDTEKKNDWLSKEKEKMVAVLTELKTQFKNGAKMQNKTTLMVDALLPKSIEFSKEKDKIYYIDGFNERIEIA